AIIGILAAVAIPKFADLINKSKEGATKGSLGALRSTISVYYGDSEGLYPQDDLTCLTTNAKYIAEIPAAKIPKANDGGTTLNVGHPDSTNTTVTEELAASDAGGWSYNSTSSDNGWGTLVVNCTHQDSKQALWSEY
ncbi:MAG: hypothetical protein ABIG11_08775, partial [bacterium]